MDDRDSRSSYDPARPSGRDDRRDDRHNDRRDDRRDERSSSPVGGGYVGSEASERWERVYRANAIVPSPTAPAVRKKETTPYRLTLRSVTGMRVPDKVAREAGGGALSHRLSVSFFDAEEKRFFGERNALNPNRPTAPALRPLAERARWPNAHHS